MNISIYCMKFIIHFVLKNHRTYLKKIERAYVPANTSSNITPYPPGHLRSTALQPNGLNISINLNSEKPTNAIHHVLSPQGAAKSGIHVPTYSTLNIDITNHAFPCMKVHGNYPIQT